MQGELIHDGPSSEIHLDREQGIVYKTIKGTWNGEPRRLDPIWMHDYRRMTKDNPYFVKVFDQIDDQTFTMEYIPNVVDTLEMILLNPVYYPRITKRWICKVASVFPQVYQTVLDYSAAVNDASGYFWHSDLGLNNIVVTRDLQVIVMDPDSCRWHDTQMGSEKMLLEQLKFMIRVNNIQNMQNKSGLI